MPAYFISFHTYGTRLHGAEKGSVDHEHNKVGAPELQHNPRRAEFEAALLKHEPVTLDAERRWVADHTIREVCEHRGYELHAINVRTTHVHVVVSAGDSPGKGAEQFQGVVYQAHGRVGRRRTRNEGLVASREHPLASARRVVRTGGEICR
jgi:hypothetical protein